MLLFFRRDVTQNKLKVGFDEPILVILIEFEEFKKALIGLLPKISFQDDGNGLQKLKIYNLSILRNISL